MPVLGLSVSSAGYALEYDGDLKVKLSGVLSMSQDRMPKYSSQSKYCVVVKLRQQHEISI